MKKYLLTLFLPLSASTLALNVVSCNDYIVVSNVWTITDGGTIADKSFNEYAWRGSSMYAQEHNGTVAERKAATSYVQKNNKVDPYSRYRASYFEQNALRAQDFLDAYKTAKISAQWAGKPNNFLDLPGYKHQPYIGEASQIFSLGDVILLDSSAPTAPKSKPKNGLQELTSNLKNVVSVSYSAEVPSFDATLSTLISLNLKANKNIITTSNNKPNKTIKLSTFGGFDVPTAVDNYMWGVVGAAMFYNAWINDETSSSNKDVLSPSIDKYLEKVTTQLASKLQPVSSWKKASLFSGLKTPLTGGKANPAQLFSFSFAPGKGSDISKTNFNEGVNILEPVAGPQTSDSINVAKAQDLGKQVRVIGVDSPQANILNPETKTKWVYTSAEKRIDITSREIMDDCTVKDPKGWLQKNITAQVAAGTSDWQATEYDATGNNPNIPLKSTTFDALNTNLFSNNKFFGGNIKESLNTFIAEWYNSLLAANPKADFGGLLNVLSGKGNTYLIQNPFIEDLKGHKLFPVKS